MKTLSLALFALTLLAPQGENTLRRTLKEGTTDTYTIVDKVEQTVKTPGGEIPMKISTTKTYVLKTSKVDAAAGNAVIEATTTFDKIEADGPAAQGLGEKPKPTTQTGKIDVRGRLTFDKSPTGDNLQGLLSGTQNQLSAGTFVELPEKAVKIGDQWDIIVPKGPLVYDQDQKLVATLVGEKEVDGIAVWVVSVKGLIKTAVDSSKLPNAKGIETPLGTTNVKLVGQTNITGEGLVEKSTGRTISMVSKGVAKTSVELVEIGFTLETNGTGESTVTLKKE